MVFNKDNRMIAAQWSMDSHVWIEIGEVTGNSDGDVIDGVAYDHVMPVELDGPGGTVLNLKLGYNNLENPYEAAQRFIDKNSIPQHHLKQIAEWIQARAGKQTPTIGNESSSNSLPFSNVATRVYNILPSKAYATHDELPNGFKTKLISKIIEFNTNLSTQSTPTGNSSKHILTTADMDILNNLVTILEDTSHYHSSKLTVAQLICIDKILSWESQYTFPGFDLLRLVCLVHPGGSTTLATFSQFRKILEKSVAIIFENQSAASSLCIIRFLGNVLKNEECRKIALSYSNIAIDNYLNIAQYHLITNKLVSSKPIRIATLNLLFNLSMSMNMNQLSTTSSVTITIKNCIDFISLLVEGIRQEIDLSNQEFLLKYLLSLGTCFYYHRTSSSTLTSLVSIANQLDLKNILNQLVLKVKTINDAFLLKCIEEILSFL